MEFYATIKKKRGKFFTNWYETISSIKWKKQGMKEYMYWYGDLQKTHHMEQNTPNTKEYKLYESI